MDIHYLNGVKTAIACLLLGISPTIPIPSDWKHTSYEETDPITEDQILSLYNKLKSSISYEAFKAGLTGYIYLKSTGTILKDRYLTIMDLNLSSNKERLYVIDFKHMKVIHQSLVAHGKNSGNEFAKHFSNKEGSLKTSLGFYLTAETYIGKHQLSLKLDGLESCNDAARERGIVIHKADYVSEDFIKDNDRLGRSHGCPALPNEGYLDIISKIRNGTCLYIHHKSPSYHSSSKLIRFDYKSIDVEALLTPSK